VQRLNASGERHAVSGRVAKALYGLPRFTKDLDVLVLADYERVRAILAPSFRTIAPDAFEGVTGYVIEFFPAKADWELEMLDRAKEHPLGTERVKVLDPHDWTALKLLESKRSPVESDRHLADAKQVFLELDLERIARLAARVGAEAEFHVFQARLRPGTAA
jgi:hypothetical protein